MATEPCHMGALMVLRESSDSLSHMGYATASPYTVYTKSFCQCTVLAVMISSSTILVNTKQAMVTAQTGTVCMALHEMNLKLCILQSPVLVSVLQTIWRWLLIAPQVSCDH